jgi:hypothetical protein
MKKYILAFMLLAICYTTSLAQVTEKVEPSVASLMKRYVDINKSTKTISGWRIQILATTDRQRIEEALNKFSSLYPNIPADWVQSKPYFKLRAGAYTSKQDAIAAQYLLRNDYPTAYPVQDNEIKPEELIR